MSTPAEGTLGGITREQAHSEDFTFYDAMRVCDLEGITLDEFRSWYDGNLVPATEEL